MCIYIRARGTTRAKSRYLSRRKRASVNEIVKAGAFVINFGAEESRARLWMEGGREGGSERDRRQRGDDGRIPAARSRACTSRTSDVNNKFLTEPCRADASRLSRAGTVGPRARAPSPPDILYTHRYMHTRACYCFAETRIAAARAMLKLRAVPRARAPISRKRAGGGTRGRGATGYYLLISSRMYMAPAPRLVPSPFHPS